MFQKILVPVDGSETGWKALKTAAVLGEKFQGELQVFTVTEPYDSLSLFQIKGGVSYEEKAGNPAELILEKSREDGCDSVVMGSRGLSGITEFLLGSVSSKVSQYAEVPVFVVK